MTLWKGRHEPPYLPADFVWYGSLLEQQNSALYRELSSIRKYWSLQAPAISYLALIQKHVLGRYIIIFSPFLS